MRTPIISMWMPWSNWVAEGWKTIETRTHPRLASLRGRTVGIHSSRRWDNSAVNTAYPYLGGRRAAETARSDWDKLAGHIIATAHVFGFRELTPDDEAGALIECKTLLYGLLLTNVKKITPIEVRGKQGIFYYDLPEESS